MKSILFKVIKQNWNYISITIALLIFVLITTPNFLVSQTQNFRITHYTINEGLSHNYVYCILQDSKGFMWFGTRDGLNKFDGYNFTHYKHKPFDNKSIAHNIISDLLEDKDGMIWIATSGGGLCRYDRFKNEFISLKHNLNNSHSLSDDFLKCLYLDDSGKLWIGTVGGLSVLDIPSAEKRRKKNPCLPLDSIFTFVNYQHDPSNLNSIGSNIVRGIVQDRIGNFLIVTNSVIDHFNTVSKKWTHYFGAPGDNTIKIVSNPDTITWSFSTPCNCIMNKKEVVVLNYQDILRFDEKSMSFERRRKVIDGEIYCEDSSSNFWSGNFEKELYVIPKQKITGENKKHYKLPKPILTSNELLSGAIDAFGSVWIGTDKGIYKFDRSTSGFNHISLSSNVDEHNKFNIRTLYEDRTGNVWLGTVYNSLRILDIKNSLIAMPYRGFVPTKQRIGENVVNTILEDTFGNYWLGTRAGVYLKEKESDSIKRILYKSTITGSNYYGSIFSLLFDHHGRIWFGGAKGYKPVILKYNKNSNTFDSTDYPLKEVMQKSGTGVWKFLEDSKHRIWIGTTNGVFLIDEPSEKISHFFYKADDPWSLSQNETWVIFEDHSGNIWIGTMGGGLNLWNQQTGNFSHFMQENGLAGNIVFGILEDEHSNLWISTNNGISKFNLDRKVFRNYLTPEIRDIGQFSNACLKTKDGFMMFGGQNGIIRFYPDSIRADSSHALIIITSLSILGNKIRDEIGNGEEISIPYKENYFSMEFAALDYRDPRKLQYAYKLEGVNNNWIHTGTQRFCSYSNLSPGDYAFKIRATNSDGMWNDKGISIIIHIIPPIYLTTWFKLGVIVLMLLFTAGLINWRMNLIRRKELEKRRLIESELHTLRLQMNPHFIFNSLNAIQNFVINSDAEKATEYLSKFARLMRMILENSKQLTIPLKDEIEFLQLYLEIECLRFDERFDYTIQVDPALSGDFEIPSMLLQPYIENAIRHGLLHRTSKGKLTVKLALLGDTIVASIIDNGIGRKKAMEIKKRQGCSYKPLGMEITHDRLKILNSFRKKEMRLNIIDLHSENGEPNGTQIEISIPL